MSARSFCSRTLCQLTIITAVLVLGRRAEADSPVAVSTASTAARDSRPEIMGDHAVSSPKGGIVFDCPHADAERLKAAMADLLDAFHWQVGHEVILEESPDGRRLSYRLKTADQDTDTLGLSNRADLNLGSEQLTFTRVNHKDGKEETLTLDLVSQKEILAALLSPGRVTEFKGGHGAIENLRDHLGIRQNTVRWTQTACWEYAAQAEVVYDPHKWDVGKDGWSLKPGVLAHEAIADAFCSALQYKMGCQRACRFIMVQGIMDYYANVKNDGIMLSHLNQLAAGRPLNEVAPPEADGEPGTVPQRGKYLDRQLHVPWNNWVPGDWGYIRNPDEESHTTISGYEGSNILYIGRGVFGVYYSGPITRTLDKSLLRVFHWRYETKNPPKKQEETPELLALLRKTPSQGGMLLDHRFIPQVFELSDLEGTAENE